MSGPNDIACGRCKCWVPDDGTQGIGKCHAHPPSVAREWPATFADDWCHQFVAPYFLGYEIIAGKPDIRQFITTADNPTQAMQSGIVPPLLSWFKGRQCNTRSAELYRKPSTYIVTCEYGAAE